MRSWPPNAWNRRPARAHAWRAANTWKAPTSLRGASLTARQALPSWLDDAQVTSGVNDSDGFYVEVSHPLPIVFSSVGFDLTLTRRVDMPHV